MSAVVISNGTPRLANRLLQDLVYGEYGCTGFIHHCDAFLAVRKMRKRFFPVENRRGPPNGHFAGSITDRAGEAA